MRHSVPIFAGFVAAIAVLVAVVYEDFSQTSAFKLAHRVQVLTQLSTVRAKLEAALNSRLTLVHGLAAFAKVYPTFSEDDFYIFATDLMVNHQDIRSLQLAPRAVVTYIHPLKGNEAAKGHDLLADPARREAAERAIAERKFVIAGPVKLKQGGEALIGRNPIYVPAGNGAPGEERFWGFSIILIDLDPLLKAGGVIDGSGKMRYALRGKDGLGASGAVFFGDQAVFDADSVKLDISLPHGSWQLAGLPNGGWTKTWPGRKWFWGGGGGVAVVVGLLVYLVMRRTDELRAEIADHEQTEIALQKAKKEAEFANNAKSAFLAAMSHDLRTPLNAIIGFSEIMQTHVFGPLGDRHYEEYAKDIYDSGRLLVRLINSVLDLSKIEAGKYELVEEDLIVASLIHASSKIAAPLAEAKKIRISTNIEHNLPMFRGDETTLVRVINNLLSNAIKFTPAGGEITVSARSNGNGSIYIAVSDTGIGMSGQDILKALKPFEQINSAYSKHHEGTGLGLSLCQKLVELHGGRLDIKSEVNNGTTVTLFFPPERTVASL
ncbi:MAG: hypothetical protein A3G18_12700 [Rhodospirillales bacterium RIFCSPLOWO2_12_FULL_58_28]|nr:MAG: hypothetical protein A3H92_10105 [Rhodospirillales bacterium RIFCSPLOWO2_02_FULL_58_16]OHC77126.1 MAG: hypothetical protein A3G18_12700 [Rhodospirillales bacterium RIFCSPLOWO2_12_FULL_58_28]